MARPEGLRIRTPAEPDYPAIAELLGELGYPSTVEQVAARLTKLAETGADHVLVAELDGRVVGVAALHVSYMPQMDEPRGELTALVTLSALRRRGIARALVNAIEALAREQGCTFLFLRTNKRRQDAQAFYRALRFQETHLDFNVPL